VAPCCSPPRSRPTLASGSPARLPNRADYPDARIWRRGSPVACLASISAASSGGAIVAAVGRRCATRFDRAYVEQGSSGESDALAAPTVASWTRHVQKTSYAGRVATSSVYTRRVVLDDDDGDGDIDIERQAARRGQQQRRRVRLCHQAVVVVKPRRLRSQLPVRSLVPRLAAPSGALMASLLDDKGGFRNLGNTCYMNAVLQALMALRPFVSACRRRPRRTAGQVQARVQGRAHRAVLRRVPRAVPQDPRRVARRQRVVCERPQAHQGRDGALQPPLRQRTRSRTRTSSSTSASRCSRPTSRTCATPSACARSSPSRSADEQLGRAATSRPRLCRQGARARQRRQRRRHCRAAAAAAEAAGRRRRQHERRRRRRRLKM
jgi:hypothetical protein